jgi:hypothetical protein
LKYISVSQLYISPRVDLNALVYYLKKTPLNKTISLHPGGRSGATIKIQTIILQINSRDGAVLQKVKVGRIISVNLISKNQYKTPTVCVCIL